MYSTVLLEYYLRPFDCFVVIGHNPFVHFERDVDALVGSCSITSPCPDVVRCFAYVLQPLFVPTMESASTCLEIFAGRERVTAFAYTHLRLGSVQVLHNACAVVHMKIVRVLYNVAYLYQTNVNPTLSCSAA